MRPGSYGGYQRPRALSLSLLRLTKLLRKVIMGQLNGKYLHWAVAGTYLLSITLELLRDAWADADWQQPRAVRPSSFWDMTKAS